MRVQLMAKAGIQVNVNGDAASGPIPLTRHHGHMLPNKYSRRLSLDDVHVSSVYLHFQLSLSRKRIPVAFRALLAFVERFYLHVWFVG